MTPTPQILWNINILGLTLISEAIWQLLLHNSWFQRLAVISSLVDESFNLFVPFKDRNKLFLGLPHRDEMTGGEIMSMKQFECLPQKLPNVFKANSWTFSPRGGKENPWNGLSQWLNADWGTVTFLACKRKPLLFGSHFKRKLLLSQWLTRHRHDKKIHMKLKGRRWKESNFWECHSSLLLSLWF